MRRLLIAPLGACILSLSSSASAQPKNEPIKDTKGNPLGRLVMLHDLEASRQTQIARSKMKAGDCKAAVDGFDAALKGSNDPTLRRDRGICHETLGHPFPAIEDYRAYLTALPEAPDAENIRERLERLRGEVRSTEPADRGDVYDTSPGAASGQASGRFSLKAGKDGASASGSADASASASAGAAPIATSKELSGHDAAIALERREAALAQDSMANGSALRRGTGPVLGVVGGPRFWASSEEGAGVDPGFLVAGTLRLVMNKTTSLMLDIGYTEIQPEGTNTSLGGLLTYGGVEFRIPLNPMVSDALIAGVGLGYERYKRASLGLVTSAFVPRGRFGYRHVFGPSFGFEATLDAGFGVASVLETDRSYTFVAIGPNVGVVTAF